LKMNERSRSSTEFIPYKYQAQRRYWPL